MCYVTTATPLHSTTSRSSAVRKSNGFAQHHFAQIKRQRRAAEPVQRMMFHSSISARLLLPPMGTCTVHRTSTRTGKAAREDPLGALQGGVILRSGRALESEISFSRPSFFRFPALQ